MMSEHPQKIEILDSGTFAASFPGYTLDCLLASDETGSVYRAVQTSLQRNVAVRVLARELATDTAFNEAFVEKAKSMAQLNHQNVIRIYEFGEVGGLLFIIMEYVHGKSLHRGARGTAIDPQEVVRLITSISNGLAHAHDHGVVHGALNPWKVLLNQEATAKIGGFGQAAAAVPMADQEKASRVPFYLAPETGDPSQVDQRADIFSLGVMLHELLTGKLPVEDPRPPSQISGCHSFFDQLVKRATQPDPASRYGSISEFLDSLKVVPTNAPPTPARMQGPPAPIPIPMKKKKNTPQPDDGSAGMVWFALLLLILIGGCVGYYFKQKKAAENAPPVVVAPVEQEASSEPEKPKRQPKPKPEKAPEIAKSPTPEPEKPKEEEIGEPIFNVAAFLDTGRQSTRRSAKAFLTTYDQALKTNCQSFEGALSSNIRKLSGAKRDAAMESSATDYKEWQSDGYRVPDRLPSAYENVKEAKTLHATAAAAQKKADEQLAQKLASLSAPYVAGVQKKIEALRPTNDPNAVKLLEKELSQISSNPDYFSTTILGRTPKKEDEFILVE